MGEGSGTHPMEVHVVVVLKTLVRTATAFPKPPELQFSTPACSRDLKKPEG